MINAGKMDRQIIIEEKSVTRDDFGAETVIWQDVATVWAEVLPISGREVFNAGKIFAEATTLFRIRWRSGLTEDMRISYGGQYYGVSYLREVGRRELLEITASRIDASQRNPG